MSQRTRIVCGQLPPEQVRAFLAYANEIVPGVEKGSTLQSTGEVRIVDTLGWPMQVKNLIMKWQAEWKSMEAETPRWACAITTITPRIELFTRTVNSIHAAGFPAPTVFVDGGDDSAFVGVQHITQVHARKHNIKTYSHWLLSLIELYLRDAEADRYIIFQDDLVCCRNLREYLDRCKFPHDGYWNLYTAMDNETTTNRETKEVSPITYMYDGWHHSNQRGQGGLALVFDNQAVVDMLTQSHMYERMWDHSRRHKYMDGAVVSAMRKAGRFEYIHSPGLVQHTGHVSSIGNNWSTKRDISISFRGEDWDALSILGAPCET